MTIGLWPLAALVFPGFYLPYPALVETKMTLRRLTDGLADISRQLKRLEEK